MAQDGTLVEIYRWAAAVEAGGVRGAPGAFFIPRGYGGTTFLPRREQHADDRQLDSRRRKFASHPGAKSCELTTKFMLHSDFVASYGPFFRSALGEEVTPAALGAITGTNNASQCTVASGALAQIVQVILNDGRVFYLPLKTGAGTAAGTYAIHIPSFGGATVTDVNNPAKVYREQAGADVQSFRVSADQGQDSDEIPFVGKGMVPTSLALSYELRGRMGFDMTLTGVDWDQTDDNNPVDPGEYEDQFAGWNVDVAIQDLAVPAPLVQQNINSAAVEFAPDWRAIEGTVSRSSSGANLGSPVFAWKPGTHFNDPIEVVTAIWDPVFITDRTNKVKKQLLFVFVDGGPGDVHTRALVVWFPQVVLTDDPEPTDVGGIRGYRLRYQVEHEETIDEKCVVAFF
jgi:hypothetical protein